MESSGESESEAEQEIVKPSKKKPLRNKKETEVHWLLKYYVQSWN